MKLFRRIAAATLVVVGVLVVAASPAQAGSDRQFVNEHGYVFRCHEDTKTFSMPGIQADVDLGYEICLGRKGSTLVVTATINQRGHDSFYDGWRKWDGLDVVWLFERRLNGSSVDHTVQTKSCDLTAHFNKANTRSNRNCGAGPSYYVEWWWTGVAYDSAWDWSVDGYLNYNIDADGEGYDLWNFTGSPLTY